MRNPTEVLKQVFGFDTFRPLQEEIIAHRLEGKDSVVLMPTGGGKSLCYQIPAIIEDGMTIVISPLIALMIDQVQRLRQEGVHAAAIHSMSSYEERRETYQRMTNGTLSLLYISPEKVFAGNMLSQVSSWNINGVAIDEAHCVSSWGHSFRQDYGKLYMLKEKLPDTPFMALTATADVAVRQDIGELLGMDEPRLFLGSFDRPNLSLSVKPGKKKYDQISAFLASRKLQSGIIYCLSRKKTERLSSKLKNDGYRVAFYHAGMPNEKRMEIQNAFIQDEIDIICATIAFGMGIDKPDIRFVIHQNLPSNLESFYQEIGRAGRDNFPADTVLFYSYADVIQQKRFIDDIENEHFASIQLAKLERMQQYAQSQICRRRILLSYFNEYPDSDCQNCDVCLNPPEYFNGTEIVQMALSAVGRSEESLTVDNLIKVLRGSRAKEVIQRGWHRIKTYGVGYMHNDWAWDHFIRQMVQLGLLTIDYKLHHVLRITPRAKDVLFKGNKVDLVTLETFQKRSMQQAERKEVDQPGSKEDKDLYEKLRQVRLKIARYYKLPPYTIFSNETLRLLSSWKPTTPEELIKIKGVGKKKLETYGNIFLSIIRLYENPTSSDLLERLCLSYYEQGFKKHQIIEMTEIDELAFYTQFANIQEKGYKIRIEDVLDYEQRQEMDAYVKTRGGEVDISTLEKGEKSDIFHVQLKLFLLLTM